MRRARTRVRRGIEKKKHTRARARPEFVASTAVHALSCSYFVFGGVRYYASDDGETGRVAVENPRGEATPRPAAETFTTTAPRRDCIDARRPPAHAHAHTPAASATDPADGNAA